MLNDISAILLFGVKFIYEVMQEYDNPNRIDCYIDVSKTIFICTGNDTSTIPEYLLNRMLIIHTDDYKKYDKIEIAKRHIINKEIHNYPLFDNRITFTDDAIETLVDLTDDYGARDTETAIRTMIKDAISCMNPDNNERFIIDKDFISKNYVKKFTVKNIGF